MHITYQGVAVIDGQCQQRKVETTHVPPAYVSSLLSVVMLTHTRVSVLSDGEI